MSKVADEVFYGLRCAVCEIRFEPGDRERGAPGTSERVHVTCWTLDDKEPGR